MLAWLPIADLLTKVAIALTTGVLGLLAWRINNRQAKTASDKLKLDLFDRRYAVYRGLTEWISDLQGRVVPDEEYTVHILKMQQAQFLFGQDVNDWLAELRKKARAMNHARRVCQEARNEDRDRQRHAEIMEATRSYHALTMEFDRELERTGAIFAPYLDFSKNL